MTAVSAAQASTEYTPPIYTQQQDQNMLDLEIVVVSNKHGKIKWLLYF